MSESKSSSGGVSFCGLLAVSFIVLKLCGVIAWSWWWVTAPLWGGIALVLVGLAIYGLGVMIKQIAKENGRINERAKYPLESKWQQRLREIQEEQIAKRKNNAHH